MTGEPSSRWWCHRCGIVRDVPHGPGYPGIPFCQHNAAGTAGPAVLMVPIPTHHPCYSDPPGSWDERVLV